MEFADGGDLFHMRGQLYPAEVTSLLWQLLQAVQYLHSLHIWHRDIKSQNAFIHWEKGVRVVKLGDFGSARSALLYDLDREPVGKRDLKRGRSINTLLNQKKDQKYQVTAEAEGDINKGMRTLIQNDDDEDKEKRRRAVSTAERSFKQMDEAMMTEDLYANIGEGSTDIDDSSIGGEVGATPSDEYQTSWNKNSAATAAAGGKKRQEVANMAHSKSSHGRGFKAPLTRVVATPCYRAPEVVMSRGGYTSALDMWGVGCIFGELLQRVAYIGSASNPNLAVAPLFALRCFPKTPETGETFGRPECSGTRRELQALFDVVGTPSWRDAGAVEMEEWRRYLERLPGKAPTLYRRFKAAGEVAVHLLTRLLDFDPVGRAACEEALAHEFFAAIREELHINTPSTATANDPIGATSGGDVGMSSASLEQREEDVQLTSDAEMDEENEEEREKDIDGDVVLEDNQKSGDLLSVDMRVLSFDGPGLGETLSVDAAAAAATLEALHSAELLAMTTRINSVGGVGVGVSIGALGLGGVIGNNNGVSNGIVEEVIADRSGCVQEESLLPPRKQISFTAAAALAATTTTTTAGIAAEEVNPGRALALLEEEVEIISESAPGGLLDPSTEGYSRLRQLLETEVAAAAAEASARTTARMAKNTLLLAGEKFLPQSGSKTSSGNVPAKIDMAALGPRGASLDYGKERLSNVADTVQGRIDPNKFLGSNRHGEWTAQGGGGSVAPGPRWGVTAVPPGLNAEDPRVKEIIKKQQGR